MTNFLGIFFCSSAPVLEQTYYSSMGKFCFGGKALALDPVAMMIFLAVIFS
jgi:hypothetical protein